MERLQPAFLSYDPDLSDLPALARELDFADYQAEVPIHSHRKGQLIIALHGAVTCTTDSEIWIVPPSCGVWIPGRVPHSARATANARLNYLFVEPDAADLPKECCTLSISPMIREMVHRLAREKADYSSESHAARIARVVLEELALMPREHFNLPVSSHTKIRTIAAGLTINPADRSTLGEWAKQERAIFGSSDAAGNRTDIRALAPAVASCCGASATGQWRNCADCCRGTRL